MTNILKRLGLTMVCLSGCMLASANEHGIIITAQDGSVSYVQFSESPKISFSQNDEVVFSMKSSSLAFPLEKIDNYSFGSVPEGAGVKGILDLRHIDVSVTDTEIIVKNVANGTIIRVFSLSGDMKCSIVANGNSAIIDTSSFDNGVYVVDLNSSLTFKLYKK